jgi:hypothetical protein
MVGEEQVTPSDEELQRAAQALGAEYGVLMTAVTASWSASLARTTIFLGVLSAAGVALGFVAQSGANGASLSQVALVVLPLLLFLGVATFVRLVQVQREAILYITGMNRIRHFMQQRAPASRAYFVLPPYDDEPAIYRGLGAGIRRRRPRFPLLYLAVQTQGIVGIVTAGVAAVLAAIAVGQIGTPSSLVEWGSALVAFLITVAALFTYWQLSLRELFGSMRPINPTPPDQLEALF